MAAAQGTSLTGGILASVTTAVGRRHAIFNVYQNFIVVLRYHPPQGRLSPNHTSECILDHPSCFPTFSLVLFSLMMFFFISYEFKFHIYLKFSYIINSSERILFKVAVLTYRALNGSAPAYLSSYFTRVADVPSRSRLRSSASEQLIVPSFNLTTVGKRAFPVSAANLWNSLPTHLTSAPSLATFRQRLKTFLFRRSYPELIL